MKSSIRLLLAALAISGVTLAAAGAPQAQPTPAAELALRIHQAPTNR